MMENWVYCGECNKWVIDDCTCSLAEEE